jgi:pyruvate/2-oxoglutarate dehydrogenase complex dihydrolipoamide dehydrogenase (E3) component
MQLIPLAGEIAPGSERSAFDEATPRIGVGAMGIMNNTLDADVLIIGWGKGGKAAAADLGKLGKRVVLVEQSERMYGGTCPNIGCVPSKGLVHRSGKRRPTDPPQEFYERAVQDVQAIREFMRIGSYQELNSLDTVTIVVGRAAFIDPHTVVVEQLADHPATDESGSGPARITAEIILIDTGAEPIIPGVPGLRESKHTMRSTDLIESTVLPERLAILGGGYLGLEFASIYRGFGSQVTVFEKSQGILTDEDQDVANVAAAILAEEGIELLLGTQITEVRDGYRQATVIYETDGQQDTLEVDTILAASGRAPASRNLGLDAAGVRTSQTGAIEVDDYLRTSQPHIYALGNVNGAAQHTYISLDDGRIVIDQLVGEGRRSTADRVAVPRTLFITPPFASVGLTETQAREAGYPVKIASQPVAEIHAMPRAYAVEETRGLMKFVIDAETDAILGAALLTVDAQELINTVALAMRHGVKAAELRDAIYTHPSATEAFNDVLGTMVRTDEPVATVAQGAVINDV